MASNNAAFDAGDEDLKKQKQFSDSQMEQMVEDIPNKSLYQLFREYPKCVFFIFGNEFCERFSYYGMRAVLTLYLLNILKFGDDDATALYHGFIVLCYFSPIFGSILADGYIGKFHTILWISLLYATGNIILAVASTQASHVHPWLDIIGLIVIGIGTGGIKPCVVSFGGDQFKKGQEKMLERFFSIFYFAINAGSTISTFITPIFRTQSCLGNEDSCYPLAFGVPAMLMVVACVFFIFGAFWYKRNPPKGNILAEVVKVIAHALSNRSTSGIPRDYWLEHYLDDHICKNDKYCNELGKCEKQQLIKDIKVVLKILVLYIPLPVFWALYDQQGSRWIIQGTEMSSRIGSINLLPDQVPTINPVLIMLFIPIFSWGIYPLAEKCVKVTPLRKMTVGGLLAVVAYIVAAFVQLAINKTLPVLPESGTVRVETTNYMTCDLTYTLTGLPNGQQWDTQTVKRNESFTSVLDFSENMQMIKVDRTCGTTTNTITKQVNVSSGNAYYLIAAEDTTENYWDFVMSQTNLNKPTNGEGEFKMNFNIFIKGSDGYELVVCQGDATGCTSMTDKEKTYNYTISEGQPSDFFTVKPRVDWHVFLFDGAAQIPLSLIVNRDEEGGIYTYTVTGELDITKAVISNAEIKDYTLVTPNTVSILWQVPQYVVITAAEILFSITGLEFSYNQAPVSMKSVLQAIWLLSVAFGDVIVIIVAESKIFSNMAYEFILFAALMFVVIVIFALLAQFNYEYNDYGVAADDDDDAEDVKKL